VNPLGYAGRLPRRRPRTFLTLCLATGLLGSLSLVAPVMAAAPLGQNIWLRANANNLYVSADQGLANVQLVANRTSAGAWETFTVVDAGGGLVELRASNGRYVSADSNLATYAPLVANRTTASTWEKFQWIDAGTGQVQLKAQSTAKFVSADQNRSSYLVADRATASGWETFTWGAGTTPPPTAQPTNKPTATPTGGNGGGRAQSTYVTSYGYNDNDDGNGHYGTAVIAYPNSQHAIATEGSGTYTDPVTFATDPREIAPQTIVYVPYLHKYFRMEDGCAECTTDWNGGRWHIDLFMGPNNAMQPEPALDNCEGSITRNSTVYVGAGPGYPVDTQKLFQNGQCTAHLY
jgi:hypothetical protein